MPEYDGPERRKTTLAQLLAMQNSMTELSHEVGRLAGELESVNKISRRQDHAEETTSTYRRRQRRTNTLITVALLLVLATLISLAVLAGIVAVDARATSRQFDAFRQQTIENCQTRNAQSAASRRLIDLFSALTDDSTPRDVKLHEGLANFEQTIPGPIDCSKLR